MIITEGAARIETSLGKVSRKMPVFYNPAMKLNRDASVLLLKSIENKNMRIADPLAASGVRSVRFVLELGKGKVKEVFVNDASPAAVANIRKNLRLNNLARSKKITVANSEANIFLLKNKPFDYVDIDPFGSPVPFLDSAVRSLSRNGILGVTATDTAALSGTSPKACLRKYWAFPLRNYMMHELGLRILIRRVQLIGASHEKALVPIYSFSRLHYMRAFFRCATKLSDVEKVLNAHKFVVFCSSCLGVFVAEYCINDVCSNCGSRKVNFGGPLWTGSLWDKKVAAAIAENNKWKEDNALLNTIAEEAKIGSFGFYDTHYSCQKLKLAIPRLDTVIAALKRNGFSAARTHFSGNGLRSNADLRDFVRILTKCVR